MDWTRRLRIRQLTILIALHESRNLSKAALRLAMTQPALSKALRELETDLGVALFERHPRGLVPTAACDALAARSRLMLNELDRTAELLRIMTDGKRGKIHVGASPVAMTGLLPDALQSFLRDYPKATVAVMDRPLEQLLPQLLDGRLDLIVSRLEDRSYGGDIAQERLYSEVIAVVCGPQHRLAQRKKIGWTELLAYPWIGPSASTPLHRELEHELALANQPAPEIAIESTSMVLVTTLLACSDMVSVISRKPAEYFQSIGRVKILPVPIQRVNYVGALWRKNSPLGELEAAFLAALRMAAGRLRGQEEA